MTFSISKSNYKYLLVLFIATLFNNTIFFLQFNNYSIRPYMIVILVGLLIILFKKKFIYAPMVSIYFIIMALSIIPHIYSSYSNFSTLVRGLILIVFQILTFIVVSTFYKKVEIAHKLHLFKRTLQFLIITSLFLYIFQVFFNIGFNEIGVLYTYNFLPRMTGLFKDPNNFAIYLTIFFWIYVYLKQDQYGKRDNLLTLLYSACILLSLSRGAIISNIVGVLLLFIANGSLKKRMKLVTIISMFTLLVYFLLTSFNSDINELIFRRFNFSSDNSVMQRFELLKIGLNSLTKYPFGVGLGNMELYYLNEFSRYKVAHNDFISVLIEAGIVSLVLYLMYFVKIFLYFKPIGKIMLVVVFIFLNTLTLYNYDPIVPIFISIALRESLLSRRLRIKHQPNKEGESL